MKPYVKSASNIWLRDFEEANIIPKGLRNRDLERYGFGGGGGGGVDNRGSSGRPHTVASTTMRGSGGGSGGDRGGGGLSRLASLGPQRHQSQREPELKCPNRLLIRQFVKYKPSSSP